MNGMTVLDMDPERNGEPQSLRGLFRDQEQAETKQDRIEEGGRDAIIRPEEAPSGATLYHVIAQKIEEDRSQPELPQEDTAPTRATRMAVETFRQTVQEATVWDYSGRWYKPFDIEALQECVSSYDWDGTTQEVAAGILSGTIIVHSFPNANHRTSLFLTRLYLTAAGISWPSYSLEDDAGKRRFYEDVYGFVTESKLILQLLRRRPLLNVAWEEGYSEVRLGPDTHAPIREEDLEESDEALKLRHESISSEVIRDLAGEEAEDDLQEPDHLGLRGWVDWYTTERGDPG